MPDESIWGNDEDEAGGVGEAPGGPPEGRPEAEKGVEGEPGGEGGVLASEPPGVGSGGSEEGDGTLDHIGADAEEAAGELADVIASGSLTTGGELLREMEEVPPEPPLYAPPGGPRPPGGLRFDFAWERQVVEHHPADRQRNRIVDKSSLVPLPLSPEAVAEWTKIEAVWLHAHREGGEQDYDYLWRKGHLGAVCRLFPADPEHRRFRSQTQLRDLLVRLGFPLDVANREAKRREKAIREIRIARATPAYQSQVTGEEVHHQKQTAAQRAFLAAMKKKEKK